MSAAELLSQLRELGVRLRLQDGELKVSAPQGALTAELREQLKASKADLIELLQIAETARQPAQEAIPHIDRQQRIPLSFAQQRMWFLEEFEGGSSVYNISWAMRLKGQLHTSALQTAANQLVERHESLRTVFVATDAEPEQRVLGNLTLPVETSTLPDATEQDLQAHLESWSREPFALDKGPLLRIRLIRTGDNEHVLMMVIHHIISDAWSLDVLQREFFAYYFAACADSAAELPPLPLQFADYASWQRNHLQGEELERQLSYWTEQLRGVPPLLELPTDRPRPPEQSYRGARLRRLLPLELRDQLQALAKQQNVTLFMVLLAAFDVLLSRYSGQDDIVVGTPIAGRQQTELEGLIGLFLNTLVFRADLSADPSFIDLLSQVQTTALDAYAHQELPFDKLVDALQPSRDISHSPIFQVQFMLQNAPSSGEPVEGLQIEAVEFEYGTAKFDLTMATGETPDGLMSEIEYSTDLFDAATIERMLEHFEELLRGIVANPTDKASSLPLTVEHDREQLQSWNATQTDYPQGVTLQSLLEAQAAATPDATALIFATEQLTYGELNARANQLAHWLTASGVGRDTLVGVYMERSIEMVVALLGIIKAGGAYVPLDPDYPEQRLLHMLEDADISLLLLQEGLREQLPATDARLLSVDAAAAELAAQSDSNPPAQCEPDSLAYVIFTSGSTGRPKGVMNEHHGITNRLLWMQSEYQLAAGDRVLQKTPFSFDVSVWEFFWPLLTGATLVVARPGGHKDSNYLSAVIREHDVTTMHFVPSMLQVFLQDETAAQCTSLRRVICSGEALSHDLQTRFFATFAKAELHNLYGPTEAAIDVTYWACQRDSQDMSVPIGRPVANTCIYVVEPSGNPAPVGVAGELWIGGAQVARGYVSRPDLTAERFIPDPFSAAEGARIYRTGDLVRWRNDGVIEFLGRIDHQVKLRGFRIELGEIEATLDALDTVEQSLVLLREDVPGDKRLVAYVTGAGEHHPETTELRAALKEELPEYMVPAAFVVLQSFPLLPNGKADRSALPEPEGRRDVASEFMPPTTPIEKTLADIWADLLRVDRVGINDNFFEMGGDSILSIQIITRAGQQGLRLIPKQVFQHQTIAELAAAVGTTVQIDAEQGQVTGSAPLTPVQQWFFSQPNIDLSHFNQSISLRLVERVEPQVLDAALQAIRVHHDALRLQFSHNAGSWTQSFGTADPTNILTCIDLSDVPNDRRAQRQYDAANELQAGLQLDSGNLIAAVLFDHGPDVEQDLIIAVHHLAMDGLSWRVILEDLETLCTGLQAAEPAKLPAKSSSFKAWANRLAEYGSTAALAAERDWWLAQDWSGQLSLEGRDHPDNTVASQRVVTLSLAAEDTTRLLQNLPRAYRTQINDALLATLSRAWMRWSGNPSLLVDLEGHGREEKFDDIDVSRTVGWFTTIYPVRLDADPQGSAGDALKSAKEKLRSLPDKGFGYGVLRYLADDATRSALDAIPAAPVLFNYLGQFDQTFSAATLFELSDLSRGYEQSPQRQRSHVLDVNSSVLGGQLQISLGYSEALHDEAEIRRLGDYYLEELQLLLNECGGGEHLGFTPSDFPLAGLDQPTVDLLTATTDVTDIYPATAMQHGMLFQSIFSREAQDDLSQVYVSQVLWDLEGNVDAAAFERAWQLVADRHEVLRTSFYQSGLDQPLAIVHQHADIRLNYADWSDDDEATQIERLKDFLDADRNRGFDLQEAPLMRIHLLRFGPERFRFIWNHHHVIMDGWSIPLVIGELFNAYEAITHDRLPDFDPVRSYKHYIDWLAAQDREEAAEFWGDYLGGIEAPTALPGARRAFRGTAGKSQYDKLFVTLTEDETQAVRQLARDLRLTPNTLAQGIWALVLSRYTGDDDVVFGATTSGRPADLKHVEDMVGLFLNALPVRISVDAELHLREWLTAVQEDQLAARQHEYASLVDVQSWSDVPRGTPLFHSLMVYENYPEVSSLWSDKEAIRILDMQALGWTNFPLTANVAISRQLVLRLSYDQDYYDAGSAAELAELFTAMMRAIVSNPDVTLRELLQPPARQPDRLIEQQSAQVAAFRELPASAEDSTLAASFERQVADTPDAPAVVADDASWSYAELNARANGIAAALLAAGAQPGQQVGLVLEQNAAMVAAILGALKAGLVYVPLDPNTPQARLEKIRTNAELAALLTDPAREELANALADGLPVISTQQTASEQNPTAAVSADDLAYILFTSGSTGIPKGVMQTHRNVLHHVRIYIKALLLQADDRLIMVSSYGYDAAIQDIFGALLAGASVHPFDMRAAESASQLLDAISAQNITVFHGTPTVYRFALEHRQDEALDALRLVVLGGEEARVSDFELFREHLRSDAVFVNGLGLTESTLALQFFATHDTRLTAGVVPVGHAVEGTELLLLDELGEPAVLSGEICIRGAHITPGYWNDSAATAAAFMPTAADELPIYRTGDLGHFMPDGSLVYLGRRDAQIKLRGNRIEPGEVEAVLAELPEVDQCVVILREDPDDEPRLVAYLVASAGMTPVVAELRRHAQESLAPYMVPSAFVEVAAIPRLDNGKLDVAALPAPVIESDAEQYVAPRTHNEQVVADIWSAVLRVEQVGIHDDFFALGGHSLIATQLMARIRDAVGQELPLHALFETPTVAGLCESLEKRSTAAELQEVVPRETDASVPLTFQQQRLWFLDQLDPDSSVWQLSWALRLRDRIDAAALAAAVTDLCKRHESLRISFAAGEQDPLQVIAAEPLTELTRTDLRGADEAALLQHLETVVRTPLPLASGPLLHVELIELDDDDHVLFVMIHHIISDAWSSKVLMNDLAALYGAHRDGRAAELPPLPLQYGDYACWQRNWLSGAELDRQIEHWRTRLADAPLVLEMPTDRPRPPVQTTNGAHAWWRLSKETSAAIQALAAREGCTLFMLLISAYGLLLGRYSRQEDLLIGTPIAGRRQTELERLIGFFVNTLVMRTDFSGQPTYREFLQRVKAESLDAFAHQDVPFEKLVEELQPVRDQSRSPLFQALFILHNTPDEAMAFHDMAAENVFVEHHNTKFELTFGVWEDDEGIGGSLEYNTDLFDAATIEALLAHFDTLIHSIAANPDQMVLDLPMLKPEEQTQLLAGRNETAAAYPDDTTLDALFAATVARTPDAIAAEFGDTRLTYTELDQRANQLAHRLREMGVGPDVLVGLSIDRSLDLLTGVLGVHKAGGGYVPLDPAYPEDRIAYMLEDSGAQIVVTQRELVDGLPTGDAEVICIDELGPLSDADHTAPAATGVLPTHLAYVIYTSGSTGKPKGVQLEHYSVINFLTAMMEVPGYTPDDRILAITTLSFDISVLELFLPMLTGGTAVIASREQATDGYALKALLEERNISILQATPATWRMLLQADWQGTAGLVGLIGGEALERELAEQITSRGCELWNMYGPTESTVWCSAQRYESSTPFISVGRPIHNMRMYILDEQFQPVPDGVGGELFVGGVGVGRGYRGRPELNAERYLPDPFNTVDPQGRMYRTGDLARFLPDGTIQIIGRTDFQVKLRGFRIELGEIEAVLTSHPAISQTVVILREDVPGDQRLVAYLTGDEVTTDELRNHAQAELPEYMVPSAFVQLDVMPLTPNGKVNRKALPIPDFQSASEYVAPRTPLEEQLVEIWAGVLGIERVGINDDFFALGGHSLLATQVMSRIRDVLGEEPPLRLIFSHPRVADFAAELGDTAGVASTAITPTAHVDGAPMSFSQQRLWFLHELEPDSPNYNISGAMQFDGELQLEALQNAVDHLVARHESLRTLFTSHDNEPVQVVQESLRIPVEFEDIGAIEGDALRDLVTELSRVPYNLRTGPLLQVKVLRRADDNHVVFIGMHHIISDAWSNGVFVRELAACYNAYSTGQEPELPALPIQYPDYAIWQHELLAAGELDRQVAYWREQLQDAPSALDLPTDRPRPPVQTYNGAVLWEKLPDDVLTGLHRLANQHQCTLFMVMLAAVDVLLSRYSGQQDIVVGSPIAGRQRSELENQIGAFINTLALRTDLSDNPTLSELLARVRKTTLDAYAHQDVPFERLVEELQPVRDTSRTPIFQVAVILQNAPGGWTPFEGLRVSEVDFSTEVAKFDLTVEIIEGKDDAVVAFGYNTDLFDAATMQAMFGHLGVLLQAFISADDPAIGELNLLAAEERRKLLVEWNDTALDYARDGTMHGLFEARAAAQPEAIALYADGVEYSYAELNRRANKLAAQLLGAGLETEQLVGVCVERCADMITGLLAILKAGGAYVPIDPNYPAERVAFMLSDSEAAILLTQTALLEQLPEHNAQTICLDSFDWQTNAADDANPDRAVAAANLGYTIYTSGSTGLPKGVEIEHRNAVALIEWADTVFTDAELAGVLASTSVCFDLSVFEIFVTLGLGGRIVLVADALAVPTLPDSANVTLINTVPSAIAELVRMDAVPASVQTVNLAGEPLSTELVNAIYAVGTVQNVNDLYGPSEDTTYSTWTRREANKPATIGRPIGNTQVYLLDPYGQPVPTGVIGEMYLGGAGVTRGYRKREELTAEKFLPDPFSKQPDARMYRTGDQARYRRDGMLEFLGRIDQQIKLRGFRIELGEIESRLREQATVKDAVVIVREDTPGDQRLVAYITAAGEQAGDETLRSALAVNLPGYMIPAAFVRLDDIPLTPNGKVDRKALPAPEWAAAAEYVAPRNAVETQLAEIWASVLRVEQVGIHDDFFAMGGHSLLAMQLASRVRDALDAQLSLVSLFSHPTVAALAEHLGDQVLTGPQLQHCDRSQPLPMSFAQQRLWFLDVMEPGSATYNVPLAIRLVGELDIAALQFATDQLVARHESLRTTFADQTEGPVQIIHPDLPVQVEQINLTDVATEQLPGRVEQLNCRPFDLHKGPLLRVSAMHTGDKQWVLSLCMHHIICDAWSQGVLLNELARYYAAHREGAALNLPDVPFGYADYAVWQRDWLAGGELARQYGYWETQLGDAPPLLDFPLDKPRPAIETHVGALRRITLDEELAAALRARATESGCTVFVLLLTALNVLLNRYSGDDDIVIGTPISGRQRAELEGVIGFFLNTLAIRTRLDGNPAFAELLNQVKQTTLDAFAHQDLPFEKLVEELQPERNLSHAPIFQVLFVFHQMARTSTEFVGLKQDNLDYEPSTAKFDLQFTVSELSDGLSISIQYNTDLFESTTIDRLLQHFSAVLEAAAADLQTPVRSINLLGASERQQLLREFNATERDFATTSVVELVESQVERTPDAIAIEAGDSRLSYVQLNARANRLANCLVEHGVAPGTLVAVSMDRGLNAPVALLAVLKSGGAYVPVDPNYPAERVSYMLEDSGVQLVLTRTELAVELPATAEVIDLDSFDWESGADTNPGVALEGATPAYAIYTSGSTGQPKGVALPQGGLANLLQWQQEQPGLDTPARTLQFASFSFDVSFQELFSTWQQGGTLVMIDEDLRRDLPALARFINEQQVERCFLPYAAMQPLIECALHDELVDSLKVRDIIVAGEQLQVTAPVRQFFHQTGARLHNHYGPSETHVVTACTLSGPAAEWPPLPPIGKPVANTQTYVLDENLEPLPTGVPGELYIGGVQVGLGYLGREALTAEKFIADPFSPGSKLYRTGDRARFMADGQLEYLGRTDDQVKWRGFRIEPGEIEALLASHAQVQIAAVLLREDDPGDQRLVAYLVAEAGQTVDTAELRRYARDQLPEYMVPSNFITLDALPLTPSGKVNRRQLPAPERSREGTKASALPESYTEKMLAQLWATLLKVDQVGLDDNFFDLGGHSLLTIKLTQQIEAATGAQLSIADVFGNPTIRELSPLLENLTWDTDVLELAPKQGKIAAFFRIISRFIRGK